MEEKKERLWNERYIKIMIANFSMFFAFYILTPLLPLYMTQTFHASKDIIGIVLSGYSITALMVRPFSGFFVDSFPRKQVLMLCFAMFLVFFFGYIVAASLLWFALVRILHGGPFGALTVANTTVAIDVLPSSRRNEGLALYGVSNNMAMAVAPTIAIVLYKWTNDFQLLFWVALIVAAIGLILDQSVKLDPRPAASAKQKISLDRFFLIPGWLLAINIIFFGFCIGIINYYLAIYSQQERGITGGAGTFYFLLASGLILSRLVGQKSLHEGKLSQNAAKGLVVSTIAYILFIAVPTDWSYYLSALILGLGNGHMWPAFQNMMLNMGTNAQRGTANSTTLTSWDTGVGLGILFGGIIAEHSSFATVFWVAAVVHFLGLVLYLAAGKRFFERGKLR